MPSAGPALMKPSVKIILIFVPAYATILLFTQALMCVGRKTRRKQRQGVDPILNNIGVETTTTTA